MYDPLNRMKIEKTKTKNDRLAGASILVILYEGKNMVL